MYRIYLAGPITGQTYGGATTWRDEFRHLLPAGIQCLSPMRGKEYLAGEAVIHHDYPQHVLSCQRGIMTRDFYDCTRADLVVANMLGATSVSIGTVMEIAWTFAFRRPLVLVIEEGSNLHDHPMIREAAGFRVTTIEEAAKVAKLVLWPESMDQAAIPAEEWNKAATAVIPRGPDRPSGIGSFYPPDFRPPTQTPWPPQWTDNPSPMPPPSSPTRGPVEPRA